MPFWRSSKVSVKFPRQKCRVRVLRATFAKDLPVLYRKLARLLRFPHNFKSLTAGEWLRVSVFAESVRFESSATFEGILTVMASDSWIRI
jgi:hypothetical protein